YFKNSIKLKEDGTRKEGGIDLDARGYVRDEDSESTKAAREFGIPLWGGNPFGVRQLLHFGKIFGANLNELKAMALGYYCLMSMEQYSALPANFHTMHEVLDVAANFGVPYNALVRTAGLSDYPRVMMHLMGEALKRLHQQKNSFSNEINS